MPMRSAEPRKPAFARLKKRADFVACSSAKRISSAAFVLQMRLAPELADKILDDNQPSSMRLGYTVSKKNGNSVKRNRIRRRLKAAISLLDASIPATAADYVIVARPIAITTPFLVLQSELTRAFGALATKHSSRRNHMASQPAILMPVSLHSESTDEQAR